MVGLYRTERVRVAGCPEVECGLSLPRESIRLEEVRDGVPVWRRLARTRSAGVLAL